MSKYIYLGNVIHHNRFNVIQDKLGDMVGIEHLATQNLIGLVLTNLKASS